MFFRNSEVCFNASDVTFEALFEKVKGMLILADFPASGLFFGEQRKLCYDTVGKSKIQDVVI